MTERLQSSSALIILSNYEKDFYQFYCYSVYACFQELLANTTGEWSTFGGVSGYKFTSNVEGYTDKFIFLPAAGDRYGSSLNSQGTSGGYWSASVPPSGSDSACILYFFSRSAYKSSRDRCNGRSVRPVLRK